MSTTEKPDTTAQARDDLWMRYRDLQEDATAARDMVNAIRRKALIAESREAPIYGADVSLILRVAEDAEARAEHIAGALATLCEERERRPLGGGKGEEAPSHPPEAPPAKLADLAPIVRDLRAFAVELEGLDKLACGDLARGLLSGGAYLVGLVAERLATAEGKITDRPGQVSESYHIVYDSAGAIATLVHMFDYFAGQEARSEGERNYMERVRDRLEEDRSTLWRIVD